MKHLGDITKINGYEIPVPDVIVGGSPCQDLSVAGKRAGLDGERSGLFMEQVRITKELREHDRRDGRTDKLVRPRWIIWENVPGALSSGTPKGEDFRIVLEEICKIADEDAVVPGPPNGKWNNSGCIVGNGYSVAWRILDGQFWGCTYFNDDGVPVKLGTPQRRRRIALVADLNGERAAEILFESESLSGDFESGIKEGEGIAGSPEKSVGSANCLNPWDVQSKHIQTKEGKAESLYAGECRYGGGESYVMYDTPPAYTLKVRGGREIDSLGKRAGKGALIQEELSATLGVTQDQTLIQPVSYGFDWQEGRQVGDAFYEECAKTVTTTKPGATLQVYGEPVPLGHDERHANMKPGVSDTLTANDYKMPQIVSYGINIGGAVRHNAQPNEECSVTLTSQAKSGDTQTSVIIGADLYNQTVTGDVAATVSAYSCMTATRNGPSVVITEDAGGEARH